MIYATGAQKDNVPSWISSSLSSKAQQKRILNAREMVYWYNNHPFYENFKIDLSETRDVAVIGNGNVAIDISRILLK